MKQKTLLITLFSVLLVSGITLAILQFEFTDYSNSGKKNEDFSHFPPKDFEDIKPPVKMSEVISETNEPQGYILRYDPKADMVILTACYEDGSEIIRHIKSINPRFLEPDDVRALTEGIKFTNKEDMFMQIEDYSS